MTTWNTQRALELVTGENVNYDESDWLEACRDMLRAAVAEVARLPVPYCLGIETIRRLADEGQLIAAGHAFIAASDLFKKDPYAERDRLAADLRNANYANEHAVLALKEALAEVERLNGVIEAYQLNRQWEQEHLANALAENAKLWAELTAYTAGQQALWEQHHNELRLVRAENAALRAECMARHDDYIALYSDYTDVQDELRLARAEIERLKGPTK